MYSSLMVIYFVVLKVSIIKCNFKTLVTYGIYRLVSVMPDHSFWLY
jgi:hypothetical protein